MIDNKLSYQTNFTGIKYSNNPLAIDANSFSNANNVYLNKYSALISRPPVLAQEYPYQAYSNTTPKPIHLYMTGKYDLSNTGVIYVIYNSNTTLYTLRYKSPAGTYADILTSVTINSYDDFKLAQYKQYYILFTVDGTKVLDTTSPSNTWGALSNYVDIPITVIQTGNEKISLDANQLTGSYKKQFVLKPDSDDTIYALADDETATVTFPSQTEVTYSMSTANEYTRDRLLRKLATPVSDDNVIVSMIGSHIAVAHPDRVDLSLDGGATFETIVYPTTASAKYKNTASLSDDGLCFFYVHSDGVYRYEIGTGIWTLIEVELTPSYVEDPLYTTYVEREVTGVAIDPTYTKGANYCHFVNAEKFVFMLAYYRIVPENGWLTVIYSKGLNITNLFGNANGGDGYLVPDSDKLNSFIDVDGTAINVIGTSTTVWEANPYLNKRLVKILDDNTAVFYAKQTSVAAAVIVLKASYSHLYFSGETWTSKLHYVAIKAFGLTLGSAYEINDLVMVGTNQYKVLIKVTNNALYWLTQTITFVITEDTAPAPDVYNMTFTLADTTTTTLTGNTNTSSIIHNLAGTRYLTGTALEVYNDSNALADSYTLPLSLSVTSKVIISGQNYLIYNETDSSWYTNIPIMTNLTFTYLNGAEFVQIPKAVFADQNLWLAMDKTLWIANLVDGKLSAIPLNNNVFSKSITDIIPISATSKAIFFEDSIVLCEEASLSDGSVVWHYYSLKFAIGIRANDTVITTNDGKLTIFPTRYGLAALTYQLDIAATEQAVVYLTDDIKTLWTTFYNASSTIKILHHNTQLILSNGTNQVLIYDFRTNGWYPLTLPTNIKVSRLQPSTTNFEILELLPENTALTTLTGLYQISKESDELYTYAAPYKDLGTTVISWHLTSQILLLEAPNHYKNISQLIIDQMDSNELKQSAYFTAQLYRQRGNTVKPSIELIYNIDVFAKIIRKVNWWKVLGFKWQLQNDAQSSYPTQLRLYNISLKYDISYEVK